MRGEGKGERQEYPSHFKTKVSSLFFSHTLTAYAANNATGINNMMVVDIN